MIIANDTNPITPSNEIANVVILIIYIVYVIYSPPRTNPTMNAMRLIGQNIITLIRCPLVNGSCFATRMLQSKNITHSAPHNRYLDSHSIAVVIIAALDLLNRYIASRFS